MTKKISTFKIFFSSLKKYFFVLLFFIGGGGATNEGTNERTALNGIFNAQQKFGGGSEL